jgi:quercetin dioxygenase-like cupin family protein
MPVIRGLHAKLFDLPGVKFTKLASPQTGSTENSAWLFALEPNHNGTLHQLDREEIIIAINGSAVAEIGGEVHTIGEGDALIIPADTNFKISTNAKGQFSAIAVLPVGGQAKIGNDAPFTPPWAL